MAHNGKFGPYLKKGTDTRSLLTEDQILSVTRRRGAGPVRPAEDPWRPQRQGTAPRAWAPIPTPACPMVVKDGRFGPYVTDGTTNASLRRGDDVETLTVERAAELLAERRAAGPSTRKKAAAKKKAPAKKAGGQEDRRQEGWRPPEEGCGEEGRRRRRLRPAEWPAVSEG